MVVMPMDGRWTGEDLRPLGGSVSRGRRHRQICKRQKRNKRGLKCAYAYGYYLDDKVKSEFFTYVQAHMTTPPLSPFAAAGWSLQQPIRHHQVGDLTRRDGVVDFLAITLHAVSCDPEAYIYTQVIGRIEISLWCHSNQASGSLGVALMF
uniref:Uncharacterized protein n=1 Tax=Oryza punctata TaxID=4537 RepID=A0A0E0MN85_ORYPU